MERALVERAQAGDQAAFGSIATEVGDRLYRLAIRILRNPEDAAETTQTALVDIWRDLPGLRDPDKFDAWSSRILVNRCRAHQRRARRMPMTVGLIADDLPSVSNLADYAARDELEHAFRRLSVEQRAVLALVYYRDLSLPQVAQALGVSLGTVKSRLHYARRAMRAAVEADARRVPETGRSA